MREKTEKRLVNQPATNKLAPADPERDLWRRYRGGDQEAGNVLAIRYLRFARAIAVRAKERFPVDDDAIFSGAFLGLAEALRQYDPDRGVKFMTYANRLIAGRIGDEVRRLDHVPRHVRRAERRADQAAEQLGHRLGRRPTDEELQEIADAERVCLPKVVSIEEAVFEGSRRVRLVDLLEGKAAGDSTLSKRLEAIADLTNRERYLLLARFVLDQRNHEIAESLGVCRSRASQIFLTVVAKLRARGEEIREALRD